MMNLAEKHRPQTWSEVVGQDNVVANLLRLRDTTGLGGNAFWISGRSGSGKTTIARLIAAELADGWCVREFDSPAQLTPEELRELDRTRQQKGLGKGGRVYIVNESHKLRADQTAKLLGLTEDIPEHVAWIFTTIKPDQQTFDWDEDSGALASRCHRFQLEDNGDTIRAFAERAKAVAEASGLDGRPLTEYVELMERCHGNLRAALHEVQQGRMAEQDANLDTTQGAEQDTGKTTWQRINGRWYKMPA